MILNDLLTTARQRLDDKAEPYRIDDNALVACINEAERETCRRAHLIIDKKTDSICRVLVKAGQSIYDLDSRILRVRTCYLGAYIRAGTLSWDASTLSLLDSGNGFLTAGFKEGDTITVMGFLTSGNNGIFTIVSVTAGAIVVNETGMSDETLVSPNVVTVEGTQKELVKKTVFELNDLFPGWRTYEAEPTVFVQEEDNELRLVGVPTEASTLRLTVSRLPLADMTYAAKNTVSPEIPTQYHIEMLDWAYHLIYKTDDADVIDFQKSKEYDASFTAKFGSRPSARAEQFKKKYPRELHVRPVRFGS